MQAAMAQIMSTAKDTGDQESISFSPLAREYYEPVYRFLARQVSIKADAADLTQEVFLKAHKSFHRFDRNREFAPWIFTIARRCVADYYRQRKHTTEVIEEQISDSAPNPRESALEEEGSAVVWDLASRLKPKQNQVLLLHYKEHFSIAETAEIMGISQTHVKVLLFRARAALKRLLPEPSLSGGKII